jgi:dihydrofolate reductase
MAISLDAFIADAADGVGYLVHEPTYDSRPFLEAVDTALMGRRTFEVMVKHGSRTMMGLPTYVFSRTLRPEDYPEVTIVADDAAATVAALRADKGKDLWLVGGGALFRSLAEVNLVDTVEVGVSPVLIGQGIPLVGPPALPRPIRLELTHHQVYPSGVVILHYDVRRRATRRKKGDNG